MDTHSVDTEEWRDLHNELGGIRSDQAKVQAFMARHGDMKYKVSACVGVHVSLRTPTALVLPFI